MIDACRSYEGRRDGIGFGREKQQGVITLFSCSPEESSYEIESLQRGAFTHVLLESLQLQGEGNCATVERLYQRLRYYVPQLVRQHKRVVQTPYGAIEPPSKNHLILLPKQATLTDVVALKNDALTAELDSDTKTAKQLWIRVLMVSPGDPAAILGIERLSRGTIFPLPAASLPAASPPPSPSASSSATARAVTPVSPPPTQPQKKAPSPIQPASVKPPQTSRSTPVVPAPSPARQSARPASQSQRVASFPTPKATLPNALGTLISRRRALQILGFAGGGLGVTFLGRAILESGNNPPTLASVSTLTASDFTPVQYETATVNETGDVTSQETQQSQVFKEKVGDIVLELMPIPGDTFTMGSPEGEGYDTEKPQHEVTVPSFLMGKYLVTQAQWRVVSALPKVTQDLEADPSRFEGDQRPVEQVSWDAAVEFCQRLSRHSGREYRLPSEAEWEYACRAGTSTPFHFGATLTADLANYSANYTYGDGPKGEYREQTTDVGRFPANSFGLYDMHGNVLEWCLDYWHENYEGAPTDGSAWTEGGNSSLRVLRGGSWDDNPGNCRSANRGRDARGDRYSNVGFRVVCAASWTLE